MPSDIPTPDMLLIFWVKDHCIVRFCILYLYIWLLHLLINIAFMSCFSIRQYTQNDTSFSNVRHEDPSALHVHHTQSSFLVLIFNHFTRSIILTGENLFLAKTDITLIFIVTSLCSSHSIDAISLKWIFVTKSGLEICGIHSAVCSIVATIFVAIVGDIASDLLTGYKYVPVPGRPLPYGVVVARTDRFCRKATGANVGCAA